MGNSTVGQCILFDFDGTLVASEPVHYACWRESLQPLGAELSQRRYRELCYGSSIFHSAEAIRQHFSLQQPAEKLVNAKTEALKQKLAVQPFQPMPGATELLAGLQAKNQTLALVTGSRRPEVELTLKAHGWKTCFAEILTLEDVSEPKPSPQPYLLAMERLGIGPEQGICLEDSATGAKAGLAAGLQTYTVHASARQRACVTGCAGHFETLPAFAEKVLRFNISCLG